MLLMGDEMGRSQQGNNNTYCQDNDLNWLDWRLLDSNAEIFGFVKDCIAFRKAHPALRGREYFGFDNRPGEEALLSWHGTRAWHPDWSGMARTLAFMLHGYPLPGEDGLEALYVALNMHWEAHWFELPGLTPGMSWRVSINTGVAPPGDRWPPGEEPVLPDRAGILVGERSVVVLVGRHGQSEHLARQP
jgi:glycogen operon protein